MVVEDTFVEQGAIASQASGEPYTAEWWQERTTTELRDIIKRGFSLGPTYDGAVVETERRAREALRRLGDEQGLVEQRNARIRLAVLGAVLALVVMLGLWEWLAG